MFFDERARQREDILGEVPTHRERTIEKEGLRHVVARDDSPCCALLFRPV
jgi:hypothetical protein